MTNTKPGFFVKTFNNICRTLAMRKRPNFFIGEDEFGNKYFESPANAEKKWKLIRNVKRSDGDETNPPNMPPQWTSWVQKRRTDPPSIEEIERNKMDLIKRLHRAKNLAIKRGEYTDGDIPDIPTIQQDNFPVRHEYETIPGKSKA